MIGFQKKEDRHGKLPLIRKYSLAYCRYAIKKEKKKIPKSFINCSDKDVGKTKQTINKESKTLLTVEIKLLVFL